MTAPFSLHWFDKCLQSSSASQHHHAHKFFFEASRETKDMLKSHTQQVTQNYLSQPLSSESLRYITSSFELYHLDTLSTPQHSFILPTLQTLTFSDSATHKPSFKNILQYKRYATPDNYYHFSQQLPLSEYCFRLLEYMFIHLFHIDTYIPQYSAYHRSVKRALHSYNTYMHHSHALPLNTYTTTLQHICTLPENVAPIFYKQLLLSKHPGTLYSKKAIVPSSVLQYAPTPTEINFFYNTFSTLLSETPMLETPLLTHTVATFHKPFLKDLFHYCKQHLPTSPFTRSLLHYLAMPQHVITHLQEYVLETQNIERL